MGEDVHPTASGFGKAADDLEAINPDGTALFDVSVADQSSFPKCRIGSLPRGDSRNSPFAGWTLRGRVLRTFVSGRVVHEEGK